MAERAEAAVVIRVWRVLLLARVREAWEEVLA
jgi:hypothetical protein